MTIDDVILDAGRRLAAQEVDEPDAGTLIAHRRRRRRAGLASLVLLPLLIVAGVAAGVAGDTSGPTRVATQPSLELGEPADGPIGLADTSDWTRGVWPAEEPPATVDELARRFASEVLGWHEVALTISERDPTHADDLRTITVATPGGRSFEATAHPFGDGWDLLSAGPGFGVTTPSTTSSPVTLKVGLPDGTASVRWWARSGGREVGPTDVALPGPVGSEGGGSSGFEALLPGTFPELESVVVIPIDEHGKAIEVFVGDFR